MARKVVILLIGLVCLLVLWTAGWLLARDRIDGEMSRIIREARDEGTDIACADRRISGFPFHFDLVCNAVGVGRRDGRTSLTASGLRTTALVYKPNHILAEFHGPAALRAPALRRAAAIDWSLARLSVRTDFEKLVRASFAADDLAATLDLGAMSASRLETHVAPESDDATRIALLAEGLVLTPGGDQPLQAADLTLTATIGLPAERLADAVAWSEGVGIPVFQLHLGSRGFALRIEGPVRLDRAGRINGTLTARAVGLERLAAFDRAMAQGQPTDRQRVAAALVSAFGLVGVPDELDGQPARRISILFREGNAFAGFIPLGRIPPLF